MNKTLLCIALSTLAMSASAGSLSVSVIDKDGKPVPDAVVVVMPANKSVQPKIPMPTQAAINQEKMQFIPAMTVVYAGAKVRFANNDAWDHHVRMSSVGLAPPATVDGVTKENGFALRLEGKTEGKPAKSTEVTLDRPGAIGANLLGCFIHGSMSGHVWVADSPWTVKTDAFGVATLEDVPDGLATVKVWHSAQLVDLKLQSVTLGPAPAKATVQLEVVPRRRRA